MTTFIVLCLIQKLVIVLDKIGSKRKEKNNNFCPSLNDMTHFVYCTTIKNTKIPILFSNIKNIISLSLIDTILFCPVLPCFVMFCHILFYPVLTVLQIKRTLSFRKAEWNLKYTWNIFAENIKYLSNMCNIARGKSSSIFFVWKKYNLI
jgi:hypothetical protein